MSQYLEPYQKDLARRLRTLDPFGDDAPYFHLCRFHAQSNSIGAALYYVSRFIDSI